MRVEGETRSGAVVDPPDDIGAAVCKRANLRGEADGFELRRKEGGGLDLPSRWVLRVDRDEPLEEAQSAERHRAHPSPVQATSLLLRDRGCAALVLSGTGRGQTTAA